jgi:hypothetical protein
MINVEIEMYSHNLLFSNLMDSDSGTYICTVVSTFQNAILSSNPAHLDVFSEWEKLHAASRTSVHLECPLYGPEGAGR